MTFPSCHPAFWKACKRFALKPIGSFFVFNFFTRLQFPENCGANLPAIFLGNDVAFLAHHEVVSCSIWPNGSEILKNPKKYSARVCWAQSKKTEHIRILNGPHSMAWSLPYHVQIKLTRQIRQIFFRFLAETRDASLPQLVTQDRCWLRWCKDLTSKSTCSTNSLLPKFYPDHRIVASLLSHNSWSQGAMLSDLSESEKSGGSSGWSCSSKARLWWSKQQHRGSSGITEAHKCGDLAAIFWRSVMEATCRNLTYWFLKTCRNTSQYRVFSVWHQAPNYEIVESKYSKNILQILCESYVIATWDIHAQVVQVICFDLFRPTRRLGNAPVKDNCQTYRRHRLSTKLLEFSFPVTSKFFPSDKMPMDFESNAVHGSQVKINYTKYRVNAMSKDEHNKGPRKMQMKFESGQSSICPSPCPECSFFARFDCPRNPVACLRSIRSQNDQSWGQFAQ